MRISDWSSDVCSSDLVESADAALELCDAGEDFDVIISDIEMPGMNGFEFASKVTKESRWSSPPIVALSSFSNPKDLARGRAAGIRDYVAQTDRDALLTTLIPDRTRDGNECVSPCSSRWSPSK